MLCSGRMLACSGLSPGRLRPPRAYADRLRPPLPARRWRVAASAAAPGGSPDLPSSSSPPPPFGAGAAPAAAAAASSSSGLFDLFCEQLVALGAGCARES